MATFQGKGFCIAGKFSKTHGEMKQQIETNGGKVGGSVSRNTDYLVCTPAEVDRASTKVTAAKKHGVRIVSEDFITLSITNHKLADPSHHTLGTGKRPINEMSPGMSFPPRRFPSSPDAKKKLKMNAEGSRQKVEHVFLLYADAEEPNAIGYTGMIKLCTDLQVQPDDIVMLIMAWKFSATTMCKFTKNEFVNGMIALAADSVETLRSRLPVLRQGIQAREEFRSFYNFAFQYSCSEGQKVLQLEMACQMWRLLLNDRYPHLELWLTFLQEKHNRAITKDTWKLFLQFTTEVVSFEAFGDDEAWPVLIDDFVDYAKEKLSL